MLARVEQGDPGPETLLRVRNLSQALQGLLKLPDLLTIDLLGPLQPLLKICGSLLGQETRRIHLPEAPLEVAIHPVLGLPTVRLFGEPLPGAGFLAFTVAYPRCFERLPQLGLQGPRLFQSLLELCDAVFEA